MRDSSGITIVARNQIRRNRADVGGGVFAQAEEIRIVDNLIAYNGANTGAGVRVVTSGPPAHHVIANNTIAYNEHGHGAGLSSNTVSGGSIKIVNNIIIQERRKALICSRGEDSPIILGDNLIQSHRRPIKGKCNVVGSVLMVDPQFVGGSREMEAFRLSATSPAIDAGDSGTARKFNHRDLGGGQRIVGESVDLGALEFVPDQPP